KRLLGYSGPLCQVDIEKLAPDMRQARDLLDPATAVEIFEPSIAVGMQPSLEIPEMLPRPLSLAILSEAIPGRRRRRAAPVPLVPEIDPQPSGPGPAGAGRQDIDGRIVGMDGSSGHNMTANGIDQGREQVGRFADPVGQSGPL